MFVIQDIFKYCVDHKLLTPKCVSSKYKSSSAELFVMSQVTTLWLLHWLRCVRWSRVVTRSAMTPWWNTSTRQRGAGNNRRGNIRCCDLDNTLDTWDTLWGRTEKAGGRVMSRQDHLKSTFKECFDKMGIPTKTTIEFTLKVLEDLTTTLKYFWIFKKIWELMSWNW